LIIDLKPHPFIFFSFSVVLLDNSKKIQKMGVVNSDDKKYETVDSKTKKRIIIDIKKIMIQLKKAKNHT